MNDMKNTDNILNVVTGNLKGEHRKQLIDTLDKDSGTKEEFRKIKNTWALLSATKPMPEYQVEDLYLDFKKQLKRNRSPFQLNTSSFLKYAAVFVLAISISALFFYLQNNFSNRGIASNYTSVIADNGQISKIILPDSSVVWLNSGTKITYNNRFAIDNREINLVGQAFFQVTKNKKIPLHVHCNNIDVKVLGTRFDVCAYPEDQDIRVVLESGIVEMLDTKLKSFRHLLNPGEMAKYNNLSGKLGVGKVESENFTSWKDGLLIFRDDPMNEVIPKLQRRYNIDIEVAQNDIYQSLFTATIKDETLEEIFKSISFACSIHYKIIKSENLSAKTKIILTKNMN